MIVHSATGRPLGLLRPVKAHRRGNVFMGYLWGRIEKLGHADLVMGVINKLTPDPLKADMAKQELAGYWTFEANRRATSRYGLCSYPNLTRPSGAVEVSDVLLIPDHIEVLNQTFLHEVAHALVCIFFHRRATRKIAGHGPEWRYVMRLLGIPADRCNSGDHAAGVVMETRRRAKMALLYRCDKCDIKIPRTRALPAGKLYHHRGCGGRIVA